MHAVDEARVNRRTGDAGDGNEEDGAELIGAEADLPDGAVDGALAQVDGDFDPGVVAFSPGVEGEVFVEAAGEIAAVDAGAQMEALDDGGDFGILSPVGEESVEELALRVLVRGERGRGGENMHAGLWVEIRRWCSWFASDGTGGSARMVSFYCNDCGRRPCIGRQCDVRRLSGIWRSS
jgi:hypothetical protein